MSSNNKCIWILWNIFHCGRISGLKIVQSTSGRGLKPGWLARHPKKQTTSQSPSMQDSTIFPMKPHVPYVVVADKVNEVNERCGEHGQFLSRISQWHPKKERTCKSHFIWNRFQMLGCRRESYTQREYPAANMHLSFLASGLVSMSSCCDNAYPNLWIFDTMTL